MKCLTFLSLRLTALTSASFTLNASTEDLDLACCIKANRLLKPLTAKPATPRQVAKTPFPAAMAIASPMGAIYSTNITPAADGIGHYSKAQFSAAVRDGAQRYSAMHLLQPDDR